MSYLPSPSYCFLILLSTFPLLSSLSSFICFHSLSSFIYFSLQLLSNYSNMILQTFDEANETTVHADRFDRYSHLLFSFLFLFPFFSLSPFFPLSFLLIDLYNSHVVKRKRMVVPKKKLVFESISAREISLAPMVSYFFLRSFPLFLLLLIPSLLVLLLFLFHWFLFYLFYFS